MDFFHVTPESNLASVRTLGLLMKYSRGKTEGIWIVRADRLEWAWMHVAQHQRQPVSLMIALPVDVSGLKLRYRGRQVWIALEDVPPERLGKELTHEDVIHAGE